MTRTLLLIAVSAGALAGCATDPNLKALQDAPSFQAGYGDGCLTSTEEDKSFSTRNQRDEYLFENDPAYRAGWRQGYLECSSRVPNRNDGGRVLGERDQYNY